MAKPRSFAFYAVLIGTLTMMMPLGTDIFLASMPAFAREYGVSMGTAEFTLSAFFAGGALGQILWGPLSDRFGRKPVAIVAVAGYFIAADFSLSRGAWHLFESKKLLPQTMTLPYNEAFTWRNA